MEAEVNRVAGEIARLADPDAVKAEAYFERALAAARKQRPRAMCMAWLWRDQGKRDEAR
jgi:Tfp pilus assembly protein PilF